MGFVTLTAGQVCAMQSWPFPCERGKIIDPVTALKWAGATGVFANGSGGGTAYFGSTHSAPADERLQWVELATGATIGRAMTAQQAADTLEGASDTVFAASQSAIGKFVDGLIASPPLFESIEILPGTIVIGVIIIVIPSPPPEPPAWEAGEQLSGIDLISIANRFQAAAAAIGAGPLQKEFLAAGTQLFEAGAARLQGPAA